MIIVLLFDQGEAELTMVPACRITYMATGKSIDRSIAIFWHIHFSIATRLGRALNAYKIPSFLPNGIYS